MKTGFPVFEPAFHPLKSYFFVWHRFSLAPFILALIQYIKKFVHGYFGCGTEELHSGAVLNCCLDQMRTQR